MLERFLDKVVPELNSGCWLWTGAVNPKGYGRFWADGGKWAHRVSYEMHVGPIPDGLELDHKCRVRCCVNPAHLEPVSHEENVRRADCSDNATALAAKQRAKTHCPRGHPYTGDNLVLSARGHRKCRACRELRRRAAL